MSVFNGSSGESFSTCGSPPTAAWSRHIFAAVYGLVFLAGLLLNGLTLKVFLLGARSSRCISVYLKNLAAADFLLSLCLPFRIARHVGASRPALRSYCGLGAPAFYLNMYASILFMGYIATHRYLKIVHPLGSPALHSLRAAHVISAATWLVLLAVAAAYVILSLLAPEAPAPPGAGAASCDDLQSGPLKLFYKAVHGFSAAVFLLVLVALLFFYGSTSRRLAAAQRRRSASPAARKLLKSRRNILALVSVFCVCFVPYHLVRLPYAVLRPSGCWARLAFFYLKDATVAVSVLNVCLDPLIYFLFCDGFRERVGGGRGLALGSGERTSGGRTPRKMSDLPSSGFLT
ncbi:P2Y purinoceptor 14-like [Hippocampus zosterae]|uniref:P2Y purinoceptor 14-like n=1 Tax=Hippocampus zosterae TaxID=109293 RepID=UPI00223CD363|nr:P2Y purinoceptor 14-like [Hippocampus zosterae]